MSNTVKVVFFDLGNTLVASGAQWIPGASQLLTRLSARGVRLGLISNTAQMTRAEILQSLPASFNINIFEPDLVIFSSEVHMEKPDERIFELAVQRAHLTARECLFCTEDLLHTLAAQRVGMLAARVLEPPASDVGTLADKLALANLL